MYTPAAYKESDLNRIHDLIERYSFGLLTSQVEARPFATHIPFLLERDCGPQGTLIGHTARANPQCSAAMDQTVMAVFSGPHAYISPTWYQSENVVPTWNYVAVHAYGKIELIDDKSALLDIVRKTTEVYEQSMPRPWSFDGTTDFIDRLLSQIIGFRIEIDALEGKWKLSQNHSIERQQKVASALQIRDDENSQAVARMMLQQLQR